jgi:bis(5'-nucleosyl)-tetraphosphatase (symmetrical)
MRWAIGDLQGCLDPLRALLAQIPADDPLIFVGDLVNRGPQSLATLRFVRDLGERAIALLGNHDLHLLAVAAGVRQLHDDDTLQEILDAPDRDVLLDWLRSRPLAHAEAGALFVHAGVLPQWTVHTTLSLAAEVEQGLRSDGWQGFLGTMYGNEPALWRDDLAGADRTRCVINALTRLRVVRLPWFDHPARATRDHVVVFGHWSTLGYLARPDVICLDSGCVWGSQLTAVRWPDRTVLRQPCPQAAAHSD